MRVNAPLQASLTGAVRRGAVRPTVERGSDGGQVMETFTPSRERLARPEHALAS